MASPSHGTLQVEVTDEIATITFGHPKGNSLPGRLLRELAAAIEQVGNEAGSRVVILRSLEPGPFCAGASFDELVAISNEKEGLEFFSGFAHVILAMRRCPKFIIARVHGKTAGGGVGLVAAADYAIAHSSASCRLSELAVGIGPFVVGPAIEQRIGRGHYVAMSVDAAWRDAAWALKTGLYARVEDSLSAVDAAVESLAATLATANPEAMAELKRVFTAGSEDMERLLFERAAISGRLVLSTHTRAAIASFSNR